MNPYGKKFLHVLNEEVEETEVPVSPEDQDKAAFKASLDDGTNPQKFDDVQANPVIKYKEEMTAQQLQGVQEWIKIIDNFATELNGLGNNSMQEQLNTAECETLYSKIARSETKKISRVAQDLRSLSESLKGYLLSNEM